MTEKRGGRGGTVETSSLSVITATSYRRKIWLLYIFTFTSQHYFSLTNNDKVVGKLDFSV